MAKRTGTENAKTQKNSSPRCRKISTGFEVPPPSLRHIKKLTDDTGMYQHAKYTIPNRNHGYCTDDNARAVIAMNRYYELFADPEAIRLRDIYLSFLLHCQRPDGLIRNFMRFDRTWIEDEPASDALGRVLRALGEIIAKPISQHYRTIIKMRFDMSIKHTSKKSPRGIAQAIFAMINYLQSFPNEDYVKQLLTESADILTEMFKQTACKDWHWFEDIIAYDNAVLPHAMFAAGRYFNNSSKYLDIAATSCDFLLTNTFDGSKFSFIGSDGWYPKGKARATFDQQPIEAAATVEMLQAAYETTNDKKFLDLQEKAFAWFLGQNDTQTPLYDPESKGCCDGLRPNCVNLNQGAESTLSFLTSLLTIHKNSTQND